MDVTSGRRGLLLVICVGLLVVGSALLLYPRDPGTYAGPIPSTFTVNGATYRLTAVATTQSQREQGLMNAKVTNSTFMLFAFPYPSQWQFWMYDTNTSLDMIWVSATGLAGSVVYIQQGAPPCSASLLCPKYSPPSDSNFVIEAKAGFVAGAGLSVGAPMVFH